MEDIFQWCREGNAMQVRVWLDDTEHDMNQGYGTQRTCSPYLFTELSAIIDFDYNDYTSQRIFHLEMIMDSVHCTGALRRVTPNWQNYLSAEELELMQPTEETTHHCT